jgi:hypothetical protein
LLTLTSVAESTDRFNTQSTARRGKIAVVSTDAKRSYRVHFLPTTFDISVEFVSNDYSQVLTFANEWLFARRNGWLKFEIAYGSTNFSISAEGEPQVSIPIREADPDNVSEYVVTSQLKLDGFISYGTLIEGQIADTIQVDGALPEGTTVWSFTGSKDNAIQQDYSPIIPVNQR